MRRFFLSACILGIVSTTQGQRVTAGPIISTGHSWFHNRVYQSPGARFHESYALGISAACRLTGQWSVGMAPQFSSEGGAFDYIFYFGPDADASPGSFRFRTNYLRMPIQLTRYFGGGHKPVRPYVSAGPSIALKLDGRSTVRTIADVGYTNETDHFKKFDLGAMLSGGASCRVTPNATLYFQVGYTYGLIDLYKSELIYFQQAFKTRRLALECAVTFPLSK